MNFLRWLSYWPVSMTFAFVTSGTIMLLGGFLLGHWWLTGCLVLAAATSCLPIAATYLSAVIAPRINSFVAWSILLPYLVLNFAAMVTVYGLLFDGYAGDAVDPLLFPSVSPWWTSLSCNLGYCWGFGAAWKLWDFLREEQQAFDQFIAGQLLETSEALSGGAAAAA
jgi:hypothetical protein